MKLAVVTPHFAPDVAPTGVVITRIVEELARRGHTLEVYTSLPWYREHRVEPGWEGRLGRKEDTPWGSVIRLHPFPASDKRDIFRRAVAFGAFSALVAARGLRGPRLDAVLAVSPPLTLGSAGAAIARSRGATFTFNVQDVYPDVAIELGVLTDQRVIAASRRLERRVYARADAITVLSEELRDNVAQKAGDPTKIRVIPNFVDTTLIAPGEKENPYRREFGLEGRKVVMYAGNVGFSQSLDMVLRAAAKTARSGVVFVINGQGAARGELENQARGLPNVRFVDMQPEGRLPEVLAAADIHLVPLKRGLSTSSVPSKTYSILAAGRPVLASVDAGSEVAKVVERSGAGIAIPPEDEAAFVEALSYLLEDPARLEDMGRRGRSWVEGWASPAAIAAAYEELFEELARR